MRTSSEALGARSSFLPPVERPRGLVMRIAFRYAKRRFGKVISPLTVFSARMPIGFGMFAGKISQLDKKLVLPADVAALVREQVASVNGCHFCQDAARYFALRETPGAAARFDALESYRTSELFTEADRAALDYATELTANHNVRTETFARLRSHFSEREICDIVWLVASEHYYNISNIGLNIESDELCAVPLAASAAQASGDLREAD